MVGSYRRLNPATYLQVSKTVFLKLWYDRGHRVWWACYIDGFENQLGDAWHGNTRDNVLLFRPTTPSPEATR